MNNERTAVALVMGTVLVFVFGIITATFISSPQYANEAASSAALQALPRSVQPAVYSNPPTTTPVPTSTEAPKQQAVANNKLNAVESLPAVPNFHFDNLRPGDSDSRVQLMQIFLRDGGFLERSVALSDTYGKKTTDALSRFQVKNGLPGNGIVDTATANLLQAGLKNLLTTVPYLGTTISGSPIFFNPDVGNQPSNQSAAPGVSSQGPGQWWDPSEPQIPYECRHPDVYEMDACVSRSVDVLMQCYRNCGFMYPDFSDVFANIECRNQCADEHTERKLRCYSKLYMCRPIHSNDDVPWRERYFSATNPL